MKVTYRRDRDTGRWCRRDLVKCPRRCRDSDTGWGSRRPAPRSAHPRIQRSTDTRTLPETLSCVGFQLSSCFWDHVKILIYFLLLKRLRLKGFCVFVWCFIPRYKDRADSALKKLLFVKLKHAVQFASANFSVGRNKWGASFSKKKKTTKGTFLSTPFLSQRLLITKRPGMRIRCLLNQSSPCAERATQ